MLWDVRRRRNDAENAIHIRRKADTKQLSVTMNKRNRKIMTCNYIGMTYSFEIKRIPRIEHTITMTHTGTTRNIGDKII